jgi:uncharacterized membrane protein YkvA (DUF1232 family)
MRLNLARARALLFEVPRTGKLAYCLMRDRRVPLGPKVAVGAALGVIVSPLDLPGWIPVIGDLDVLALGVLAVKVFVDACPEQVVEQHEAAVAAGESVFDQDLGVAVAVARDWLQRLVMPRVAYLVARAQTRDSEDEPA